MEYLICLPVPPAIAASDFLVLHGPWTSATNQIQESRTIPKSISVSMFALRLLKHGAGCFILFAGPPHRYADAPTRHLIAICAANTCPFHRKTAPFGRTSRTATARHAALTVAHGLRRLGRSARQRHTRTVLKKHVLKADGMIQKLTLMSFSL